MSEIPAEGATFTVRLSCNPGIEKAEGRLHLESVA